jgi:hypothetical protein
MNRRWIGIAFAAAAAALCVGPVMAGGRTSLDKPDRRFDHDAHARLVSDKGIQQPQCGGACHEVTPAGEFKSTGKKEHARCFTKCHGGFKHNYTTNKGTLNGAAGRVCYPCHGAKMKFRPSNLGPVNAGKDTTYVATFSHKRHTSPGAATGRQCESCHGEFGTAPPRKALAGHPSCAGCHERGVDPLMSNCAACHVKKDTERGKTPIMAPRGPNKFAMTKAFSHERHAGFDRVGTNGRDCLACHANIAKAPDDVTIPLPTMQDCYESCHNGRKAFDATGATCTRCHQGGRK